MDQERNKYLQIRMTETERNDLDSLARDYGLDTSSFVRAIVDYFDHKRPVLEIMPAKEMAPILEVA